uniref:Uncharacterized protein n=1 Tax=mine drainage metagenome TaxID=410659 RepID=E6Q2R3_9ZZZZ
MVGSAARDIYSHWLELFFQAQLHAALEMRLHDSFRGGAKQEAGPNHSPQWCGSLNAVNSRG